MSLLNCVGCVNCMGGSEKFVALKVYEKKNMHVQTWVKIFRFLLVFVYIGSKLSQKGTHKNIG